MALPADRERMIEEIAEHHRDRFNEWLEGIWEHGVAVFGKSKPQARLQWYMSQTRKGDMSLALDVDYRKRRKALLEGLTAQLQIPPQEVEQQYIAGMFTDRIPFDTRPFQVEALFQQYQQQATQLSQMLPQAEAESQKTGQPMPQIQQPVPPPMMWVQLMGMPGWFMAKVQADFRHIMDDQAKREGLVESAPAPVQVPQRASY